MKRARIRYDEKEEAFLLELDSGDGWELGCSAKCVNSIHNKETDEPMFVHYSFLMEVQKAIICGFEMVN